jgi:hypothetical protein
MSGSYSPPRPRRSVRLRERSEEPASILTFVMCVLGPGPLDPALSYRDGAGFAPGPPLALVSGLGRCPELSQ